MDGGMRKLTRLSVPSVKSSSCCCMRRLVEKSPLLASGFAPRLRAPGMLAQVVNVRQPVFRQQIVDDQAALGSRSVFSPLRTGGIGASVSTMEAYCVVSMRATPSGDVRRGCSLRRRPPQCSKRRSIEILIIELSIALSGWEKASRLLSMGGHFLVSRSEAAKMGSAAASAAVRCASRRTFAAWEVTKRWQFRALV